MTDTIDQTATWTMTVDLSVLESLGINLYSNAAAVLSELVANAYDADANKVDVGWLNGDETVVITDDGSGMTAAQINHRFLTVGYKKRTEEGSRSPRFKRPFMGRKGIGKLSMFSISEDVRVYSTTSDGQSSGLRINVPDLEKSIRDKKPYHPEDILVPVDFRRPGTSLVLSDLKKKRADLTAAALRKRLARRFDVLDQTPASKGGFTIVVNGEPITYADRQELKKLEFIWEFGTQELPSSALPTGIKRYVLHKDKAGGNDDWKVRGWIGTAKKPTDLTDDDEAGSLKNIIVLARKRPIQEGIIEKLDFSRLFGNYVTGQVRADFLDLDDGYDDIATSDRQRLIEDDPRVIALRDFLRSAFLKASETWAEERPKRAAKDVLKEYPKLQKWIDALPDWQQQSARKMLGTVASMPLETKREDERTSLLRAGVLAFERVGIRAVSESLDELATVSAETLLPLLGAQDAYEAGLWVDILRSRVEAISQFRSLASTDEKEIVLQKHLFKHLWLLDAAWERATGNEQMEEDLRTIDPKLFAVDDEGKKIHGRIDIRYATATGRHVIVELKRYSRTVEVEVLRSQGLKYLKALRQILRKQGRADEPVEVVFVLGEEPSAREPDPNQSKDEYVRDRIAAADGRIVMYDELIENARRQYEDYLNASDKADVLGELLDSL